MIYFAPKYYERFKCIADKCKHSCCIGWEIDIDDDSLDAYDMLDGPYADEIRYSIMESEPPHFGLTKEGRCPHLDENGLCKIITEFGEDLLCDICTEHPRYYNETDRGMEVGIGLSCEEACRIIVTSDDFNEYIILGEDDEPIKEPDLQPLPARDEIIEILSDPKRDHRKKYEDFFYVYGEDSDSFNDERCRNIIENLEYLHEENEERFMNYSFDSEVPKDLEKPMERILAYFVYRYFSVSEDEGDMFESLGLAVFCERLIASIVVAEKVTDIEGLIEIARTVSEEIEYSEENVRYIRKKYSYD